MPVAGERQAAPGRGRDDEALAFLAALSEKAGTGPVGSRGGNGGIRDDDQ
jgi:hypothetical protein